MKMGSWRVWLVTRRCLLLLCTWRHFLYILSSEVRRLTSIEKFKKHIRKIPSKSPLYYSYGHRYFNIIHTKLRHSCILNSDHIASPNCICGQFENAQHFFFECNLYNRARSSLFDELLILDNVNVVDTHLLLWGNELFQMILIFKYLLQFISS
jgi:hypothetical protein